MGLNLGTPKLIGQRGGLNLVVRQDSLFFRDFNMKIIQSAGAPVGNYEEGSMLLNTKDLNLYIATNFKTTQIPSKVWYKLNTGGTTVKDFSGNKFEGTLAGSPVFSTGKYGNGITFDGSDDKIAIDTSSAISFNADWTWEGWVKIPADATPGTKLFLISRRKGAVEHFTMWIDITAGPDAKVKIRWQNGGGSTTVTPNTSLTLGSFTYLSINLDKTFPLNLNP